MKLCWKEGRKEDGVGGCWFKCPGRAGKTGCCKCKRELLTTYNEGWLQSRYRALAKVCWNTNVWRNIDDCKVPSRASLLAIISWRRLKREWLRSKRRLLLFTIVEFKKANDRWCLSRSVKCQVSRKKSVTLRIVKTRYSDYWVCLMKEECHHFSWWDLQIAQTPHTNQ